ncbi:MAG: hypothetical protein JSV90_00475 [Methanobacteriota archaeon]|nr:MAG: hypothetical protein JSV90_00475 [Euryarchaeota archaeon]
MSADEPSQIVIRYPIHLFVWITIVCGILAIAALYLSLTATESFAEVFWLGVAAALAAFVALFSLPCMLTHHIADEEGLRIRMGLLVNLKLPYDGMASVAPVEVDRGLLRNRLGIGVMHRQRTDTLYVLSSFRDTVSVTMRAEVRTGLTRTPARIIVFNAEAGGQLMDLVDSRMASSEEA